MRMIGQVLVALLGLMATTADAVFHLWKMTEIYSNADGSVQFLELAVDTDGEGLLAGHTLTSTVGGVTKTFSFASGLPAETANKTMLIATQGFAALNVLVPDYIVPNGFFSAAGGSVNFADVDVWNHPALPLGAQSLGRDGVVATNSPKNFAGQTATLVAALNFQALWWGAPAGSESGWGLNLTHQGDILFATWFTYDTDGSAMWLVAPDARRTTGDSFTGALYRTTGPAFNSVPFNPLAIGVTQVGTATFALNDENTGTFTYTVNGITQSKPITRQVFDLQVSSCTAGGTAGASPNYQDLWWRAPAGSESGWGVNLTHQGNILFATWFTYDATGKGMWIVMPEGRLGGTAPGYSGKLYRTTGAPFNANPWNPASIAVIEVGSGSFSFSDTNAGTFAYTVNGISQSKAITRQVYSSPPTVCK